MCIIKAHDVVIVENKKQKIDNRIINRNYISDN